LVAEDTHKSSSSCWFGLFETSVVSAHCLSGSLLSFGSIDLFKRINATATLSDNGRPLLVQPVRTASPHELNLLYYRTGVRVWASEGRTPTLCYVRSTRVY
jgi:hypothetical protein